MSRPARPMRQLLLHADDFGMNAAVNAGILQALESGLLTSTSVLANAPAAAAGLSRWSRLDVVRRSSALPGRPLRHRLADRCAAFDLGIHFNLTQGRPLTADYPAELLDADGRFPGIFPLFFRLARVPAQTLAGTPQRRLVDRVATELRAQLEFVTAHGLVPTHLNGHQYVELIPAIGTQVLSLAREYGIETVRVAREPEILRYAWSIPTGPVQATLGLIKRHFANRFARAVAAARLTAPSAYFGTLHAGEVTPARLQRYLAAASGYSSVEIGLHPAALADRTELAKDRSNHPEWADPLATGRVAELDWLCDPATVDIIGRAGFTLGRLFRLPSPVSRRVFSLHAA
jgi:chitin disaccharide deacetylase